MAHNRASKRAGMLFVAALVAGCASAAEPEPAAGPVPVADAGVTSTPELIADGQQIFGGACSVCHGTGAVGGQFGPNLTDDEWAWIDPASPTALSDLANLIRTGVTEPRISDSGMPPMGGRNLTDVQLNALAAYILSL